MCYLADLAITRNIHIHVISESVEEVLKRQRLFYYTKCADLQDKRELDEDDDTFDVKMRLKFQKKRSSGRRHTVANIGLPSLSGRLRRGSLSDTGLTAVAGISPTGSGSGATTPEYHYVRKWSVDITALANQLENPKAAVEGRSGSYQFAELQGALKTSPCNASRRTGSPVAARPTLPCIIAEVETTDQESAEKDDHEARGAKQSSRSHDDREPTTTTDSRAVDNEASAGDKIDVNKDIDVGEDGKRNVDNSDTEAAVQSGNTGDSSRQFTGAPRHAVAPTLDSASRQKRRLELSKCSQHNAVEHVASLPIETPSIVVSGLNVDEDPAAASTNTDEDDDYSAAKAQIWTTAAVKQDVAASDEELSSSAAYDDDNRSPDDAQLRRVGRELERAGRTCVMLAVCGALTLPYACVSVWNALTTSRYVGYNLSLAAAAVMVLTAAVIPPLLVWSDRRLRSRILRVWTLATRLRCVCHCNVGRGKNCFQRPNTIRDL